MKFSECLSVSDKEVKSIVFWRDVMAEFFMTFFLVSVECSLPLTWGKDLGKPEQVGISMGFIVCTMVWSLGDFGGGHMNPAVTITMAVCMRITFIRAVCYIIVQLLGAMAGAGFVYATTPPDMRESLGVFRPGPGVAGWQAFLIETWITTILLITVLGSTNAKGKKGRTYMHCIPIGFAISLGIMAAFGSTGGSMNPALSFGPAVVMGIWTEHWVYWAGPILGGLIGAFIYNVLMQKITEKEESKKEETQYGDENASQTNNTELKEIGMAGTTMTLPGSGSGTDNEQKTQYDNPGFSKF